MKRRGFIAGLAALVAVPSLLAEALGHNEPAALLSRKPKPSVKTVKFEVQSFETDFGVVRIIPSTRAFPITGIRQTAMLHGKIIDWPTN